MSLSHEQENSTAPVCILRQPVSAVFCFFQHIAESNSVNLTHAVKVNQCMVKNQWILFGRVTSLASQESGTNHAQKWSSPEVVICYKFWLRARAIVHRTWHSLLGILQWSEDQRVLALECGWKPWIANVVSQCGGRAPASWRQMQDKLTVWGLYS